MKQRSNLTINAIQIAMEFAVRNTTKIQRLESIDLIHDAAEDLHRLESRPGFTWEGTTTNWESTCAVIANHLVRKHPDWLDRRSRKKHIKEFIDSPYHKTV